MKLEPGKAYHGFHLVQEESIGEIDSTGRVFHHPGSGARLLQLANGDDNKVFSISFRTPPHDSSGIPHILEHSVLCGSKKFPTKEPFVELAKGSLNTFLNAMTFPDKTMYPVASRNSTDFRNLMDVYLDAVFHPNIYSIPEILMQEGWHYDLQEEGEEIRYKGVVYNEMKGVYSSPEAVLFRTVLQSLFPDSCYGLESGGDPDAIPRLTREAFLNFHRSYYHPSNSYLYLYGDVDILDHLAFINEEYLSGYGRIDVDSSISMQPHFDGTREVKAVYPLAPGEDEGGKSYLSLNFVTGRATDAVLYLAMNILEYLLLETPAAPLKKALIDAEIGKDVFGQFESSLLQPVFSIVVKNSSERKKAAFRKIVYDTLERLLVDGIDKKLVEASINIKEFRLREADFRGLPKGLFYCIQCMDSWLYGADPFRHLRYETTLPEIKRALTENYFESLIERVLLHNPHSSLVVVNPEKGLAEKKEEETTRKLAEYKKSLSADELQLLVRQTEDLAKRQQVPDPPELVEKIPMLNLSDLDRKAEELPLEQREAAGTAVLFSPVFTSRIAYVNLFFDVNVPEKDLPYVSLLSSVLGRVSTERYDYGELSNEVNINTGGIFYRPETFGDKDDDASYRPTFAVHSKALVSKLPELSALLGEILGASRYDEIKRLREIIQETRSRVEMTIHESGHSIAISRLFSYFSPMGSFVEKLSGLSFYKFLVDLEKNFSARSDELTETLQRTADSLFRCPSLTVGLTSDSGEYPKFDENLPIILQRLGGSATKGETYSPPPLRKNEGLLTPGKVQYVAKGYNFRRLGFEYSGALMVLRTITSMDYLWNRVRVQGGAYGSFARFSRNGNMYFCSYRDPNLKETLAVYDSAAEYLRTFDPGDREMTKYIIGTISKLDAPLTPSMKGEVAVERFFTGMTQDDVQRAREEVLRTGKKDVAMCADMVGETMKQNCYCVIGNETRLRAAGEIFSELVPVFEG